MSIDRFDPSSRRSFLRAAGMLAGGALAARYTPAGVVALDAAAARQQAAAGANVLEQRRAQMGAVPIATTKLGDNLVMLSGPGGNVVVLYGADGKVVVDSFVRPAWPKLKSVLDGLNRAPVATLINTHWHFDHTDNNASFHTAGATILAHDNTKKRLSEPHDLLGMHFDPSPADALPNGTFADRRLVQANKEQVAMFYIPPAHTDTDIAVQFRHANVLHLGDVFFNGFYPFIDASTGGNIDGMVVGAERATKLVDSSTKVVPGHGPLGDRAALDRYRTMLSSVREKVFTMKKGGKSLQEVQAAKPTADFDATWGKGMMSANDFVALVFNTL